MPFNRMQRLGRCTVCGSEANLLTIQSGVAEHVNCSRCGDFFVSHVVAQDFGLPLTDPKMAALASHLIGKLQVGPTRPELTRDFFESLRTRALPSPAEVLDNLLIWLAAAADSRVGRLLTVDHGDPILLSTLGLITTNDIIWSLNSIHDQQLFDCKIGASNTEGLLTPRGWQRIEELRRARVASRFAFFARKFTNPDLDRVFAECLRPAVAQTGYELRTGTQHAGLIDALIENEIRRCRFLVADLSDDNAGAYWQAGFAEGLGKPVIYICRATQAGAQKVTHFDMNHRHTIQWNLSSLEEAAMRLKAVIRNTLLGDAVQAD